MDHSTVESFYDLKGTKIVSPSKGLNIIKSKDGKTKKRYRKIKIFSRPLLPCNIVPQISGKVFRPVLTKCQTLCEV